MLDRLAEESKKQGLTKLKGYYYPTAKNKMVKNLYSDFGFEKLSEDEQGNAVYELDISGYERKCKVIEF